MRWRSNSEDFNKSLAALVSKSRRSSSVPNPAIDNTIQSVALAFFWRFCLFFLEVPFAVYMLPWLHCSCIIANQPVEFPRKLLMTPWKQASATLCISRVLCDCRFLVLATKPRRHAHFVLCLAVLRVHSSIAPCEKVSAINARG